MDDLDRPKDQITGCTMICFECAIGDHDSCAVGNETFECACEDCGEDRSG